MELKLANLVLTSRQLVTHVEKSRAGESRCRKSCFGIAFWFLDLRSQDLGGIHPFTSVFSGVFS